MSQAFVYVSNAADGDIAAFSMQPDGALQPGARVKAADAVGPMAVSPDRRFLYAAVRSKPFSLHAYAIDPGTGALAPLAVSPLAESFPYIALDRTGRYLFGASYYANMISVNAVGTDGRVAAEPLRWSRWAATPHSIRAGREQPVRLCPHAGQRPDVQFAFDANSGGSARTRPRSRKCKRTGPRHFVTSADNKFLYVLSELLATVTTFALDARTGC